MVSWYLGAAESMGHTPKLWQFVNWNLIENCYTRNTGNATKQKYYNWIPVKSVCHNIHNLFQVLFYVLLLQNSPLTLPLSIYISTCQFLIGVEVKPNKQQDLLAGSVKRHCLEFSFEK